MGKNFIFLASASPRRRELLGQIGVEFAVRPADIDERVLPGEAPADYVTRMAQAKASAVWLELARGRKLRPVLAADTAVVIGERILGKPRDSAEALGMLETLSGAAHRVLTAVTLAWEERHETLVNDTEVRFRSTTQAERAAYCRSGEHLDKAGAYAIQGRAAVFVERVEGSYSGVMGLPLYETEILLRRCGIPGWLHDGVGQQP